MSLTGLGPEFVAVEFAAPLRLANEDPVCGPIAGAGEAGALDEGLQKHGAVCVAGLPVIGELAGGAGQDVGSEIAHLDPG